MRFTREEFDIMVDELLNQGGKTDMLCYIAEKTVKDTIKHWCENDTRLRGRQYHDDIMQAMHIKLLKITLPQFLLREGIEGDYNNNPEGFEDWLFTVASTTKSDFADKIGRHDARNKNLDDYGRNGAVTDKIIEDDENQRRLREAFSIVVASDASVYKVLTWVAQFIFIAKHCIPRIESNDLIIKAFEDKTLNEMYDMIIAASKQIPWLDITSEEHTRIKTALAKIGKDGVPLSEKKYKELYMKSKGEPSAKKSVSDWINRMNKYIEKELEEKSEQSKKSGNGIGDDNENAKRRCGDETSIS